MKDTWTRLTGKVRALAKRAYTRSRCLATRMRYINNFLLSKIWYTAQILPAPNIYTQLTTAIKWYIWRGTVFRLSLSTLQMRGWEMPAIEANVRHFSYTACTCKANGMEW